MMMAMMRMMRMMMMMVMMMMMTTTFMLFQNDFRSQGVETNNQIGTLREDGEVILYPNFCTCFSIVFFQAQSQLPPMNLIDIEEQETWMCRCNGECNVEP
jgi:hypothetical protein